MEPIEKEKVEELEVIDAEPVATTGDGSSLAPFEEKRLESQDVQRAVRLYILLPCAVLLVALFGGIRFNGADGSVMYLRPALIYLIFGGVFSGA
jgi:hypothetical protein